jgi:hypothetical protein
MRRKVIRVLKKDKVKVGGSVQLESVAGGVESSSGPAGSAAQQARIVESNNEYAIIEITCSCGQKTHVQCNYSNLTGS